MTTRPFKTLRRISRLSAADMFTQLPAGTPRLPSCTEPHGFSWKRACPLLLMPVMPADSIFPVAAQPSAESLRQKATLEALQHERAIRLPCSPKSGLQMYQFFLSVCSPHVSSWATAIRVSSQMFCQSCPTSPLFRMPDPSCPLHDPSAFRAFPRKYKDSVCLRSLTAYCRRCLPANHRFGCVP